MYLSLKYQLKTWLYAREKRNAKSEQATEHERVFDRDRAHQQANAIIEQSHQTAKSIVITPTTGSRYLEKAIQSVYQQDDKNTRHWVVIDGAEYWEASQKIIQQFDNDRLDVLVLPHNTGKNGLNGHRIYAALSFLVNSDYVFFLDQDNWYEPNHISSMIEAMEKEDLEWVFAMRKIQTENGAFVINDECESIGDYPCYSQLPHLIDTNCYGFRRSALAKSAHHWYHPLRADRYFFHHLKQASPQFKSTGLFTVNYRLTEGRVPSPDFFIHGNKWMENKYGGHLPWKTN